MNVQEAIQERQSLAKGYFHCNTRSLSELLVGETVCIQQLPHTRSGPKWKLGTVQRRVSCRSYIVECEGVTYRRNRRHLRQTQEKKESVAELLPLEWPVNQTPDEESEEGGNSRESERQMDKQQDNLADNQPCTLRRSQRHNKGVPPQRYREQGYYIMHEESRYKQLSCLTI